MNLRAIQSRCQGAQPFALPAALCLLVGLCALGLNPYFRPDYHDNITYYVAAESILAGEGYTFQGAAIADWPPVTSLILAGVFAVFGTSILAAKLVSVIAAVSAIILADRLLRRERRPDRTWTVIIYTLIPISLLTATTVASDWICAAFSFACLLALCHLREKRGLRLALASGLLLGLAALTRQTGILLGAAIVYQAVGQWRRGGIRMVVPEFIAAATGAVMYLSWGAYTASQIAKHPALTGNYANHGLSLFTDFSITELTLLVFDLFWKWDDVLGRLGISPKLTIALLIIPAAILVLGLITLTRRSQIHASDVYALATLVLLLGYHWKIPRYLLPIAPFLIAWFFAGLRHLGDRSAPRTGGDRWQTQTINAFAAVWIALLLPFNAYVLFNRDGNGAYRGISPLSSPRPADYYDARWADLHAACEAILEDGHEGAVASSGFYLRYTKAFTQRSVVDTERQPDSPAAYAIFVADQDYSDPAAFSRPGDRKIFETESVTVFRRAPSTPPASDRKQAAAKTERARPTEAGRAPKSTSLR